jgi:hypothetical protein
MESNAVLEHLDLNRNVIGDAGAASLAQVTMNWQVGWADCNPLATIKQTPTCVCGVGAETEQTVATFVSGPVRHR